MVGKIGAPHGVRGEVRITSHSDNPGRFAPGGVLYLEGRPHKVQRSFKAHGRACVLRLEGISTRQEAEALRGKLLTVPREDSPPPSEGTYYHHQLLGLSVYTQEGESLGPVADILATGSNDVYVVSNDGEELLIPAIESVVRQVDLDQGVMVVDLPEGLRGSAKKGGTCPSNSCSGG